jgi:predicted PurR-regulated permease PerM
MKITLQQKEKRALTITVIIGLVFGAYFLRHYFSIIVVAAIMAYIFHPLRDRLVQKFKKPGLATMLTMFAAFLSLIIPLTIVIILTIFQIESLLRSVPEIHVSDVTSFGQSANDALNSILAAFPGAHSIDLSSIVSSLQKVATEAAQAFLNFVIASVGGIPRFFTNIILFIFVFASLLNSGEKIIDMIKKINPLGPHITDLYFQKTGDMTKAVIKGQFVIAFCQGLIGAISLSIAGWSEVFFFMLLILSVLSVVPLGSGILTIPIGMLMILFGQYWQGALVLFTHIVIVTNIDNFLRARLVPKSARLNSALMMLAVFSGIGMFGFLGIVIGPIIMILILSTVQVYLAVVSTTDKSKEIVV